MKKKKQNVRTLLQKQFDNEEVKWQTLHELEFFKKILEDNVTEEAADGNEEDIETCDCVESDHELHI